MAVPFFYKMRRFVICPSDSQVKSNVKRQSFVLKVTSAPPKASLSEFYSISYQNSKHLNKKSPRHPRTLSPVLPHLPGIGTLSVWQVAGLHRASPSAALDKYIFDIVRWNSCLIIPASVFFNLLFPFSRTERKDTLPAKSQDKLFHAVTLLSPFFSNLTLLYLLYYIRSCGNLQVFSKNIYEALIFSPNPVRRSRSQFRIRFPFGGLDSFVFLLQPSTRPFSFLFP